eukprot:TRINITY_DN12224_c0_g1_i1.p1 TRINITY_DN12224_c0_g1~~TRINITY_DN12224_c0_g1_i1.p1  ORF type:complete len:140 (-),score=42.58 TRINITY_DN12224_c0_g1_i1:17-436(-)
MKKKITPLHMACSLKESDVIFKFVEIGADVFSIDEDGNNALHYYFEGDWEQNANHFKVIKYLLKRECDPNQKNKNNRTPLIYVCKVNDKDISIDLVKLFAENNANPNIVDSSLNKCALEILKSSEREEVRNCVDLFSQF